MNDTGGANQPIPTVSDDDRSGFQRREAQFRVAATVAMTAIVGAALLGFLGPREGTGTAEHARGTVEARHPHLTRPGLPTLVTVTVVPTESGIPVRLQVDSEALSTLGLADVHPAPTRTWAGDGTVEYEFAAEGEGPYEITLAGRVPPKAAPVRFEWDIAWLSSGPDSDSDDAVTVHVTTWVLP